MRRIGQQATDDRTHLKAAAVKAQLQVDYGYTAYQYKCGGTLRPVKFDFGLKASRG